MPFPNLATQFKAGPRQVEIARKGGKTVTPKRRLAAKIREMKKRGNFTDQDGKDLLDFLKDPELGAAEIYEYVKKMRDNPQQIPYMNKLLIDLHKQVHGTKVRSENVNININTTIADFQKKMNSIFGESDE